MARGVDLRTAGLERHVDHALEGDALLAHQQAAARNARDVEQVVDQARHLVDLAVDDLAAPLQLGFRRSLPLEDRHRVADRRERVAQLVGERGQELVLAPVGVAQRLLHLLALVDVEGDADPAARFAAGF